MKQNESESWFSRAKAEADKGVSFGDRFTGIIIVVISLLLIIIFVFHQTGSTGFFNSKFGSLEMVMLYGSLVAWIVTGSLDGIFGQRFLSRLFDVFGGIIFITISLVWFLVVFPFDFNFFSDVFPEFLSFLVQWISNDIAWGIILIGAVFLCIALIYSPIAYKIVKIKRFSQD